MGCSYGGREILEFTLSDPQHVLNAFSVALIFLISETLYGLIFQNIL